MYCVYLTTYSGDKLPPYYIGSTSIAKISNGKITRSFVENEQPDGWILGRHAHICD